MTNRALSCVVAVASVVLAAGTTSAQESTPISHTVDYVGGVTEHVILISIDGLRPDAIGTFETPALQGLMRSGSYSLSAMTVVPSKTLPSHTSMLTGVGPEVHGITWNSHQDERLGFVQVPTVFELAHAAGLSTAAFVAKAKFRHLLDPAEVDYFEAPIGNATHWMATRTVERSINYMRHERPNLLFVHFGEPDFAGHTMGWMSTPYSWAVGQADAAVARIVDAANEIYGRDGYTLMVTADHGGHLRTHGTADPVDRWIPWIAYGAGVRAADTELMPGIRTMDTAATVLWALGVAIPEDWAGRPVISAFEVAATRPITAAAAP
ncbi:MAG TPA: ectonucleotide pyrophosphatase/phosphodiesterase [Longimicrobiales bacterium]|nr:ectonucleotide pyrophosphatase/phosphodiesterase [Longimicrobiales bacterium]